MGRARAAPRVREGQIPCSRWGLGEADPHLLGGFPKSTDKRTGSEAGGREHNPISAPRASPCRGAGRGHPCRREGRTICALTQKGCGFPRMSFESRRDLGCCACPWLAAAGARLPAEPAGPGRGASPSSQRRRRLARRWESLKPTHTGPGKALAPRSERFRPKKGAGAVLGQAFWGIPLVFGASPAGCHFLEVTKTCPGVSAVMLGVP